MKKWIIAGTAVLAAGAVICAAAMAAMGFDLKKLNTTEMVENTYSVSDSFTDIDLNADTEDITFIASTDGKCKVVCLEEKDYPHEVRVENGTLKLSSKKHNNFHVGFHLDTPSASITVYLPGNDYGKLNIKADTGDVEIPSVFSFESLSAYLDTGDISLLADISGAAEIKSDTGNITVKDISPKSASFTTDTGNMELSGLDVKESVYIKTDTGDVKMNDVKCADFTSDGDTGDLDMAAVSASGKFDIKRSSGDVKFTDSDAEEVFITTDTGNVDGSFLTDKVVLTQTDTGDVDVPKLTSGGRCEITTDTGDISIRIK